ncbi:GtrA family protein [Cellvibrio sp. pealriver]|uniref:GtrA family protein n=1 Tax=Cellvibrio sp. pealriver TaxID=1622269 RepID=UPI00066FDD2D|nr:GtrA family protein [Cellvibrio sp. pealriver]
MKRFALFVGIGGISTLIQFLLLILFVESRLLPEVFASAVGYVLSSIFNYWANYHYTFQSTSNHAHTIPKYALAVGIGLSTNTLLFAAFLWLFDNYLALPWVEHYLVAQFLATGITVVLNFVVHKFWIYRSH